MELEQTKFQEWVKQRSDAVRDVYTAFDCLQENGHGEHLSDDITATQISCPFHGADRRPSARYYPASSRGSSSVRCFKCQESWDSINLYAKFKNLRYMDALSSLEKRFRIKIPRRPDSTVLPDVVTKGNHYVSEKWGDVPTVLTLLEKKLVRVKPKSGFNDYVKFCRVIDAVTYDFERSKTSNDDMVKILLKTMSMMDDIMSIPDFTLDDSVNE
jgi:hypothetical protein